MTESTKSVAEIQEEISKHAQDVNDSISNAVKDLSTLTKDLVQKDSDMIQAFKEQAAQDLKHVQNSYSRKEERVHKLFKSPGDSDDTSQVEDISRQYQTILQENVAKLKEIAREDFLTSSRNAQQLTEETKAKLHSIILGAFSNRDPKEDFAKTAGTIFENINSKIKDDLYQKGRSAEQTASNLAPDLSNVFVINKTKPPEEIEAERLLQNLFEEHLLELNEHAQKDFKDIDSRISNVVNETKQKVNQAIQTVTTKELPKVRSTEATEARSLPNLPRASTVEHNVNSLLNKAGADFQQVKDSMLSDVDRRKQKINDNVKYCAEKLLGIEEEMGAKQVLMVPLRIKL